MNLPAIWSFGAGLTIGLLARWWYSETNGFWMNFFTFAILIWLWPVFGGLFFYVWYKGNPMPWDQDA